MEKNGAGKTTLMRMIAGLGFPSEGSIELFGRNNRNELEEAGKRIGSLIEAPGLVGGMSAKENMHLQCLMQNLLNNCLQYTVGEVKVSITEERAASGDGKSSEARMRLCVSNLIAENSKRDPSAVFQRFYVEQEARNQSTGLGLLIVKLLVEKMQGEVFAERKENMFYVCFLLKKS